MSNPSSRTGPPTRTAMPAFGTFGVHHQGSASLLLERSNPDLRRSTPDSEALASSDDEPDHSRNTATGGTRPTKPGRRTSWLHDASAYNVNRKPSIPGPYSPSTSHPGTPGVDNSAWTNNGSSGSGPWNNALPSYPWPSFANWSQELRKDQPSRLQEVVPQHGDTGIPFSIPLEPSFKAQRSMSYSVGQLDSSFVQANNPVSTPAEATRTRPGAQQYPGPGIQRRTSRPGGLGGIESGGLGRLREVEDDEEEYRASTMRNALTHENTQMMQRIHPSFTAATAMPPTGTRNSFFNHPLPEHTEVAIDDRDEITALGGFAGRDNNHRRMSEQALTQADRQSFSLADNRAFDNMKKGHWQTSLGFGPIPEAPQSRRHSFADVPTRHGSMSSTGENVQGHRPRTRSDWTGRDEEVATYESGSQALSQGDDRKLIQALTCLHPNEDDMRIEYSRIRRHAAEYFNTNESTRRRADDRVQQHHRDPQHFAPQFGVGSYLEPAPEPLFIVNFKCCRSDVFYIQQGTGLHVNVGDLVIVEADRGTDLGTVQHTNITYEVARRYKDHYAEEHYKWLMMFSQQSRNGGPNVVNPNGIPGSRGSAVGGMGPQGHHGGHEASGSDLKPKMIKRLAQNHEIQALKDKEGNEAKAKRVCQQKVVEHRLNMEILDAEFQMDSKKLTFYYFADNYINFNHLVTDLFKIYKTRIWMSAINPASFQTPTSSLGIQPLYGGAAPNDERQQRRLSHRQPAHAHSPQAVTTPFGDTFDADRNFNTHNNPAMRNAFYSQFQDIGAGSQQMPPQVPQYPSNMPNQMDPYMSYYGQPYPQLNPNAPNFASSRPEYRGRAPNQVNDPNWMGRFQGLSLGS